MQWIAVRTTTGTEYDVRAKIKLIDEKAEVYIPRKHTLTFDSGRAKERTEKILPGYVLIGSETRLNALQLKGNLKIVGDVTEEEIEHLRGICGPISGNKIEVGSKIIVVEGPFQGVKGYIEKIEEDSYRCILVFKGMEIPVSLGESFLSVIR